MYKPLALRSGLLIAGAIVLAACGSTVEEAATAGEEELTGIHAGETPEEHAAHVEQDRLDQAGEELAAENASRAEAEAEADDAAEQESVAEEPVAEETVAEEPVAEEPAAEEPVSEDGYIDVAPEILAFFADETDTDQTALLQCMEAEASAEEVVVDDDNFQAIALLVFRCERESLRADWNATWDAELPADQIDCSFDSTMDFVATIPLAEADTFDAVDAPQQLVDDLASDCGISAEDAQIIWEG